MNNPKPTKDQQVAAAERVLENLQTELNKLIEKLSTPNNPNAYQNNNAYKEMNAQIGEFAQAIEALKATEDYTPGNIKALKAVNEKYEKMNSGVQDKIEHSKRFGFDVRSVASQTFYEDLQKNVFPQTSSSASTQPKAPNVSSQVTPSASSSMPNVNPAQESFSAIHQSLVASMRTYAYKPNTPRDVKSAYETYSAAVATHMKLNPSAREWNDSATAVDSAHEDLSTAANTLDKENPINMALTAASKRLNTVTPQVLPETIKVAPPAPAMKPKK